MSSVRESGIDLRLPTAYKVDDRATHVFDLVEAWLFSEPVRELLEAFDKELPVASLAMPDLEEEDGWLPQHEKLPEWIDQILADPDADIKGLSSAQVGVLRRAVAVERIAAVDFNFRGGTGEQFRERAHADVADFDHELRQRILRLADQLGLVSPCPTRFKHYEKTLIMGGGYRSPLLRARYAAGIQESGVSLGEVSFLGSPRFLIEKPPPERPVVEEYAPGAADEFDLMKAAALIEFGPVLDPVVFLCGCPSAAAICPAWRYRNLDGGQDVPPEYTHERRVGLSDAAGRPVGAVLSASTSRPPLRPNTSDTFALWARCSDSRPGQRVLVVTTQVFVPFQAFDGIRWLYLVHGVDVDVVGFGADWGDRPETAEYLLQETLSAIRSGRRLLVDAAEVLIRQACAQ